MRTIRKDGTWIRTGLLLLVFSIALFVSVDNHAAEIRVMTFNIWHGGDAGKQPLEQTMKVILEAKADIVGIQESRGFERDGQRPDHGARLAKMLDWHWFSQGSSPGVLSRYPIVTNTPAKHGVGIRLPDGQRVWMFNVHLNHAPYQPYQLLGIPYGNGRFNTTADEAITEARAARGKQVDVLIAELKPVLANDEPVFLTGDFNEPSHLDWTERAHEAGLCPKAVVWPTTSSVTTTGMQDGYRAIHEHELLKPGFTWTPTTRADDPKDRHDRIDFIFFGGKGVFATDCEVVGETQKTSDLVIQPFPSDHRAVVATLRIP